MITPDVIVNEGGPGAEKSSVQGKEAPVAGGGACQRGQPAHLASHHHHAHSQIACGNYHREWCEKGQEQYPNLQNPILMVGISRKCEDLYWLVIVTSSCRKVQKNDIAQVHIWMWMNFCSKV